jgi:hypothetical protein
MRRRRFLQVGTTAFVGGTAGCLRFVSGGNETATPESEAGTETGDAPGGDETTSSTGEGGDTTPTVTATQEFADDFDYPGSDLSDNGWTTTQGEFTTRESALVSEDAERSEAYHAQSAATGTFRFEGVRNPATYMGLKVSFISAETEFGSQGYTLMWRQTRYGPIYLQRDDGDERETILTLTEDHGGDPHDVRIDRYQDGDAYVFECYYDGEQVGTVEDSTYTDSAYAVTRFDDTSHRLDRVSVASR